MIRFAMCSITVLLLVTMTSDGQIFHRRAASSGSCSSTSGCAVVQTSAVIFEQAQPIPAPVSPATQKPELVTPTPTPAPTTSVTVAARTGLFNRGTPVTSGFGSRWGRVKGEPIRNALRFVFKKRG